MWVGPRQFGAVGQGRQPAERTVTKPVEKPDIGFVRRRTESGRSERVVCSPAGAESESTFPWLSAAAR